MSDKVLDERLLELQVAGLVEKAQTERTYQLSERGQSLGQALQALYDWGQAQAPVLDVTIRPNELIL